MTPTILKILLVEDNPGDARLVQEMLKQRFNPQYRLTHVESLSQGLDLINQEKFDITLLDLNLPDSQGLSTLHRLCQVMPPTAVVVLTGMTDDELGIQAIQAGAQDYLVKEEITTSVFTRFLRYAIERNHLLNKLQQKEAFNQAILNSLTARVAVLDQNGVIVSVNDAWQQFNREHDGEDYPGMNYLNACEATAAHDPHWSECAAGLRSILEGSVTSFDFEYAYPAPSGQLWFLMKATPLQTKAGGLVMSHIDVTALKQAEAQIEHLTEALAARNYNHYLAMSNGMGAVTKASVDSNMADKVLYELIPEYKDLVVRYVRAVRIHNDRPSRQVQIFAHRLADLHIQARDIVRIHLGVLTQLTEEILPSQERAFSNDARLVLLELLGTLLDIYLKSWQKSIDTAENQP
ncbi:MAG: response regulator [Anaerolineae bacterium]|nr:response regulator [Anaerolineae bacterium]